MALLNFDARTVDPSSSLDTIPAGWYNVRITESGMKPTKDGTGSYLALTLTIIDGQFANRKLFDRLNINNKSQQAKDIAYQTLSAICHATGVIQLQDSTQLHGIPLQAKVAIREASGGYDASNEVKGYKAVPGGGQAQVPAFVQPAAQPAPAAPQWAAPQPAVAAPPKAPAAAAPASPPWAQ